MTVRFRELAGTDDRGSGYKNEPQELGPVHVCVLSILHETVPLGDTHRGGVVVRINGGLVW